MNHLTLLNHRPQQNNGNEHNDGYGVEIDRLRRNSIISLLLFSNLAYKCNRRMDDTRWDAVDFLWVDENS